MRCAFFAAAIALSIALPLYAVTGVVLGPDGNPLPGITVTAFRPSPAFPFSRGAKTVLTTSKSDAKGSFKLDVKKGGIVEIEIRDERFMPVDVAAFSDEEDVRLSLRPVSKVEGKVTAAGRPVSDAVVIAAGSEGEWRTTTDANGRYRIPDPSGWAEYIAVIHPEYAPSWSSPQALDVMLMPGRAIAGEVLDGAGKPVSGAHVSGFLNMISTTTGADGAFRLEHIPDLPVPLSAVSTSGVASASMSGTRMTLRLKPASRITGVVWDDRKRPVAGVIVHLDGQGLPPEAAVSDDSGGFVFEGVPRASFELVAAGGQLFSCEPAAVDSRTGDVRQDLVIRRVPVFSGKVVDANGSPVRGAMVVMLGGVSGYQMAIPTGEVSGPDGQFRLRSAAQFDPRMNITIRLTAVKTGLPVATPTDVLRTPATVTITIPEGIALSGVVVGPDKKPIEGVEVRPLLAPQLPGDPRMPGGPTPAWATTAADGKFTGLLQPGHLALQFSKSGFVPLTQSLDLSKTSNSVTATLERGAVLSGFVIDGKGKPVAGVPVMTDGGFATSGADGSFEIRNLKPGTVGVHYGRLLQEQAVSVPATGVKLIVTSMKRVSGKVIDAVSQQPIENFTIGYSRGRGSDQENESSDSRTGMFEVEVPETASTLTVTAAGYAPAEATIADSPMTIGLSHGRRVHGRVLDEKGEPLGGVAAQIDGRSAPSEQNVLSGPDGTFELTGLAFDSDASLSFSKQGFTTVHRQIKAGSDAASLEVALRHAVVVTGRVLDASGAPAPNIMVMASSAAYGADSSSRSTDENGAFRFDDLAPVRYDFAAETESGSRGAVKDVDAQSVHDVTIRLERGSSAKITGHITGIDAAAGMVTIFASNEAGDSRSSAADVSGNYRIEGAPAGTVDLYALTFANGGQHTSRHVTVEVPASGDAHVDIAFDPPTVVHGRVSRGGKPLAGVNLDFSGVNAATGTTGPDGSYRIQIDPGDYDVSARADGRPLPFSKHVTVSGETTLDLSVNAASILATVIDADTGLPIPGAKVTVSERGETHTLAEAATNEAGSASLDISRDDQVTFVAEKRGYANASADADADTDHVLLRLGPSTGAIVRVVDAREGSTLSGNVIARDSSGRVLASADQPDSDGTVTLPIAAGAYEISASAEGYGSHTVKAHVPSSEILVPLPRGGSLSLRTALKRRGTARLIQPDGEAYVRCWCSGIATITIAGPLTLVDRIAPGSYTLEVSFENGEKKKLPVTVIEGQVVTVSLE